MHKRHAILLALLVGLLLVHGCGKERPTPRPAPEPEVTQTLPPPKIAKDEAVNPTTETPRADRAAYTVTAIGITEEFAKNREAAEKKYKDKLIEVEGTIAAVTSNSVQHSTDVALAGYKKAGELLGQQVVCIIKKALAGKAALLGKGQKVRAKGKFDSDSAGNVTLNEVEYEELTPSAVPRMPAETLAKAFADDKAAALKKFGRKEVIVQGTITDLSDKGGQYIVKLMGSNNIIVTCILDDDEFKTLKKGEKVQIKGEVSLFNGKSVDILPAYLVNS